MGPHMGGEPTDERLTADDISCCPSHLVYLHTGGHRLEHAKTESLFGLRVGIHDTADGIDILPAPGSPAAGGGAGSSRGKRKIGAGDPHLRDGM